MATPKDDGRCMSEFGGGADVQQIRVIAPVVITVLLGSANKGPTAQTQNGDPKAAAVDSVVTDYAFLRLLYWSVLPETTTPR